VKSLALVLAFVVLSASATEAAYEAATTVKDAGTLSGVVRLAGPAPPLAPLAVLRDQDACGERQASEALVIGPDRGVKGGVVRIEGVTTGKKPAGDVLLDTQHCRFVAHVSVLAAGDRARVKNSDGLVHNVHGSVAGATVFNVALPHRDQLVDITRRLRQPGIVRVLCEAHPHMFAWLVVHDSPYVAVTDERGAFRISDVPPGTYSVTLWHEGFRLRGRDRDGRPHYDALRTLTKQVTIAPRGAAKIEFELK
jgi:Polysaccharide lyase family 4, domain II